MNKRYKYLENMIHLHITRTLKPMTPKKIWKDWLFFLSTLNNRRCKSNTVRCSQILALYLLMVRGSDRVRHVIFLIPIFTHLNLYNDVFDIIFWFFISENVYVHIFLQNTITRDFILCCHNFNHLLFCYVVLSIVTPDCYPRLEFYCLISK